MGFYLDDSYTFQLCLGSHPLVGMLRKQVLLFSMNFQVLIKLYNASGTSCLISHRKYRKQCIPWLGTHTDVMHSIHYMCGGSIIYPWFKHYFTLFEIHYNTLPHPKAKEYKSKTKDKMNHNIKLSWYYANIISINHFSLLVFFLNLGIRWSVRRRSSSDMHSGSFQRILGKKALCAASVR